MNHKLFSTLAVAAALGACNGHKDTAATPAAPAAPETPASPSVTALQADAALPNIDGKWTISRYSCGDNLIDFDHPEKSNPPMDPTAIEIDSNYMEFKDNFMVTSNRGKSTRTEEKTLEGVTTGPVKVTIESEALEVSRSKIEKRDANKIQFASSTTRTTIWETENGVRKKVSSQKSNDAEYPDEFMYSVKGEELTLSYRVNPEDLDEQTLCIDENGKVLGNEIQMVMKRMK